jgi:hypothetical protein
MEDILREPVELIDQDLDEVAGGFSLVEIERARVGNGVGNNAVVNNGNIIGSFNVFDF